LDARSTRRTVSGCAALILAAGLGACSHDAKDAPAAVTSAAEDPGENLYKQNCVPCHREDGKGVPGVYPSLAQSPVANGDPAALVRWVLAGERPASMPDGRYATQMLQFGWMKDQQAAAVLSYVRGHFGNSAPPLDAAAVAAARP
jgi:mono/diheme cytochrome c family protein